MTTASEKETSPAPLVLASASPARRSLLENAGLEFEIMAADIDERHRRNELLSGGKTPAEIAMALAEAKAMDVTARLEAQPDSASGDTPMVIGADQILLFNGEIFEKPANLSAARNTLEQLRGNRHELISAVAVYRAGRKIWSISESAHLTMRDFSDGFLESYLRQNEDQCASVGAYRIEGRGLQLFPQIEGDFFTIQGLPLLPLLNFLRRENLLRI